MKRIALVLLTAGFATFARAANPVDDLFRQAQEASSAKKFDDALALYERVFTEHADASDRWFNAQQNIVQTLIQKGDLPEAAKAVHICLDGAPNLEAFEQVVTLAANILSAQDKSVDRANRFLAFEQSGSVGGQTNPMDAVGYPMQPERVRALAAFRQQAGDDADAARFRGITYLFTGKPRDALAAFADAFRRNENPYDFRNAGVELVCVGLRSAQGNEVGLDKAMQFVMYGPNGPDGIAGTPDDLADPFSQWLPAIPPAGEGGTAELSADDLAALKKVRDAVHLYAGDPLLPSDGIRRHSVAALQRLNDALDGWGAPGQKSWYLRLALGLGCPPPDEYTTGYLSGAAYAARGRTLNYGGVATLWAEIDADCAAFGVERPKHLEDVKSQFERYRTGLGQVQFHRTAVNLLTTPATF